MTSIILFVVLFLYLFIIAAIIIAFYNYPVSKMKEENPKNFFSIVIAFKNEATNLPNLLRSIKNIDYPTDMYEVVLVNDHSNDDYYTVLQDFSVRVFDTHQAGKKAALTLGIEQALNDWIITTDADCELPVDLLKLLDSHIQNNNDKMILLPVCYYNSNKFIKQFQNIEFVNLQAITIAGVYWKIPFLANGAGLAFKKDSFIEVNGYQENMHIISGDDVFLLEKFHQKYRGQISFVKNTLAVILTQSKSSWKELLYQKIRWSSKTSHYKSVLPKLFGLLLTWVQLMFLLSFFMAWKNSFFMWFIIIKFIADVLLFLTVNKLYRIKIHPLYFVLSFIFYPFYFFYIMMMSIKGHFQWKGISYSK